MNKSLDDNHIHDGHRERMRQKLVAHGQRIFDTYELLEMLLYYVIPYKDTNPISKRLLHTFGDLDGVLGASREELLAVSGIGERAATLIESVARLSHVIGAEIVPDSEYDFSEYEEVGSFLVNYFSDVKTNKTVGLFLNNSMDLIAFRELYDLDYESGAVQTAPFIDASIKTRASVVITAHNHIHAPLFPSMGDRETNNYITSALGKVGVFHAEHYVVCGKGYMGIGATGNIIPKLCQSPEVSKFMNGKTKNVSNKGEIEDKRSFSSAACAYNTRDFDYFTSLIRFVSPKNAEVLSERLLMKYRTVENLITVTVAELEELCPRGVAIYLKLLAYITSRRETDKFRFGIQHPATECADYFKALFIGCPNETIYLMAFDSDGRALKCEQVGEGTVNSSEVLPRRAVEAAIGCSADGVIIAHNHPLGKPNPSKDDCRFTETFSSLFTACGIRFLGHYIVAGQLYNVINVSASNDI